MRPTGSTANADCDTNSDHAYGNNAGDYNSGGDSSDHSYTKYKSDERLHTSYRKGRRTRGTGALEHEVDGRDFKRRAYIHKD
jgi:hypothetical protein